MSSIYIKALGMINALGDEPEQILNNLYSASQSNIRPYHSLISQRGCMAAHVPTELEPLPKPFEAWECRNNRLLAHCYRQLEAEVQHAINIYGASRVGIVLGTSTSGISDGESAVTHLKQYQQWPANFHYRQQEYGQISEFLAAFSGAKGTSYTISTACSSSAKAFASAARLVKSNMLDAVLVGGCDTLCQLTLNGFDSLESVSEAICNPFSQNRNGITIGEGAALMLLTRDKAPLRLMGAGESSDGYHISAPDPTGNGAKLAIEQALEMAGVTAEQLGYINLHGTATPKNDAMEAALIHSLFGSDMPCSSTKPLTGHTLGAAGATEIALCALLLQDPLQRLPAQIWDQQRDPELPIIGLVKPGQTWKQPIFMSNSFAFGGSNASVIIGKNDENQ
ncbi:beta-ketoacyl-[acyl-carrier-protein] synthase family protein [Dongshaea marina]|uniref:beta-ketoacyl-[acyl-carrier-protein] synthase family protein n=1 Tax=Dongshaea marina TaxID=2047966 RepID=UPI000D3E9772|nr:beta-ketoacyl-[acyl-carrier-protein] synthase family protein [Dongshaea marina]